MNDVYLLLGSNEGDRLAWLQKATDAINVECGTIVSWSCVYQTAAWGIEEQPDFLNAAVLLKTELTPYKLLNTILNIEKSNGRERTVKWGQRTLDIDILFYNNDVVEIPTLNIPHPYIQERRFALTPLNEIAPEYTHPILNKTVAEMLQECPDKLEAKLTNVQLI